jgi:hypothetical protein
MCRRVAALVCTAPLAPAREALHLRQAREMASEFTHKHKSGGSCTFAYFEQRHKVVALGVEGREA